MSITSPDSDPDENEPFNVPGEALVKRTIADYFNKKASAGIQDDAPGEELIEFSDSNAKGNNISRAPLLENGANRRTWGNIGYDVLDRQVSGRLHPWATSHLMAARTATYRECCVLETDVRSSQVLGTQASNPTFPGMEVSTVTTDNNNNNTCCTCLQFDKDGELLVSGNSGGRVSIYSMGAQLRGLSNCLLSSKSQHPEVLKVHWEPSLSIQTSHHKIHQVKWNPGNEDLIGVASRSSRLVFIYDIERTHGAPWRTLKSQAEGRVGVGDIAFFPTSSHSIATGSCSGHVSVWDLRVNGTFPAVQLHAIDSGIDDPAVVSLSPVDGGQAVLVGTVGGDIKIWDMRGGRSGPLAFGSVIRSHPLIEWRRLKVALSGVPSLIAQAGRMGKSLFVHSMDIDPSHPDRLGFHLSCGWSGVLDLVSGLVTHVHAPSSFDDNSHAIGGLESEPAVEESIDEDPSLHQAAQHRRRATWAQDGHHYAVPAFSQRCAKVVLLDFDSNLYAGGSVWGLSGNDIDDDDVNGDEMKRPVAGHEVVLSHGATCLAAFPKSDGVFVAGGLRDRLSLLQPTFVDEEIYEC
jgi:hypothetical protein